VASSREYGECFHRATLAFSRTKNLMLRLTITSVRPEFTDTLAISDGRHPIKELFDSESEEFVPK
jgi:DNA mismatch repair ATPase MutS